MESPLSTDQVIKVNGDLLEVTATVVDTKQLEWWLRGFGDQVSDVLRT